MDARGQLGCDLWSAEGSCEFQTSFRPMYSQGSNFQHIIKHPSHSSALCRRSVSTNQDRSFFSLIYSQKYCLLQKRIHKWIFSNYILPNWKRIQNWIFSIIYVQKYCLIENEYISFLQFPKVFPNWKRTCGFLLSKCCFLRFQRGFKVVSNTWMGSCQPSDLRNDKFNMIS